MSRGLCRLLTTLVLVGASAGIASAQTGAATASLSGVVLDQQNAVVAGVTVVVKNNATGVRFAPVVTNRAGLFSVAALDPGTYTVTCSLSGFKTVVIDDVRVIAAMPADLNVRLEIGQVSETVPVLARSSVIQTQSTTISSTLYSDQIRNLPLNTRNAVNFMTFLPGVDTAGNHNPQTATLINGLPQAAILITIDGIQTQQPAGKSGDGFYSYVSPSVDAIEQVTLSTATPGADGSGQGAAQIRFTTRSGTQRFGGGVFETLRHPALNTNAFFNQVNGLPINRIILNQFGGNVGGPIVLPAVGRRRDAFFFTNFEELHQASENTRTRTLLSADAMSGLFSYASGNAVRQVNVLALAAANQQIANPDPVISSLLAEFVAATTRAPGSMRTNPNLNTRDYTWNSPDDLLRRHSTTRVDLMFGPPHRLSAIYNFNKYARSPDTLTMRDPRLPGLPAYGSNVAFRNSLSVTFRSAVGSGLVNEATTGGFWATNNLSGELVPARFANQGGYSLTLFGGSSAFLGLMPATPGMALDANGGNHSQSNPALLWSLADKVTWQRGRHGWQLGGEFTLVTGQRRDQQVVPAIAFGLARADPADTIFNTVNFPGASTANLGDASFLYALLTGRVASVTTEFALDPATGRYVSNGRTDRQAHQHEIGLFAQDAFRITPTLTLNIGLRYELQLPVRPDNSVYSANTIADACGLSGTGVGVGGRPCHFFMPGTLTGTSPVYQQYTAGTTRYATDRNNLAPSVGLAWLPDVRTGALRALLGDPDQATIRVAYARAFNREGLNRFLAPYENNPGASFDAVRNVINGNLVPPEEAWPLLFRETSRLGPGVVPASPVYPLPISRSSGVNLFDPTFQVGFADSFSAGVQRALSRDMAVEVRYVGTRGRNVIEIEDWNEVNLLENGFLDEFKLAQANLYANMGAGRGQTIAYAGPGTGTSPLPTYLAYFSGWTNATDPLAYSDARWSNAAIVGRFARLNPNPLASANDLQGDAGSRARALSAGIPANFFVLNPDVDHVNVHVSRGSTRYDAFQLELRRRLSHGLAATASYSYVKAWISRLDSIRVNRTLVPALTAVPHSLKLTANYDVPFGRGRRFGANAGRWLEAVAGGWSGNLTGKVTSGSVLNFGNVRLVGMSRKELQRSIHYRIVPAREGTLAGARVYVLPQDIIDNTVKAFSVGVAGYTTGAPEGRYLAPANGPDCIQRLRGDCAPKDLFVIAPVFSRFDFGARKLIGLGRTTNLALEVDVLNLFNAIDFNANQAALPPNPANLDGYRVTSSYQDVNQSSDPGSRVGQVVLRFNW